MQKVSIRAHAHRERKKEKQCCLNENIALGFNFSGHIVYLIPYLIRRRARWRNFNRFHACDSKICVVAALYWQKCADRGYKIQRGMDCEREARKRLRETQCGTRILNKQPKQKFIACLCEIQAQPSQNRVRATSLSDALKISSRHAPNS